MKSLVDIRPLRPVVKTPGSHPGNTGSIPVGVTKSLTNLQFLINQFSINFQFYNLKIFI